MHRISLRFAPVLIALLLALSMVSFASASVSPAPELDHAISQQAHGEDPATSEGGPARSTSIREVVLWSTAALAGGLIVLSALYMLKRRIGAFPENPDWVAPIQVLYSKDAPDEGFFGDADPHAAHGAHGTH